MTLLPIVERGITFRMKQSRFTNDKLKSSVCKNASKEEGCKLLPLFQEDYYSH